MYVTGQISFQIKNFQPSLILSFFCLLALKENQNWKSTMTRLKHFNLNSNLTCNAHCTCRPEQNRIKEHNRVTWPSQTQTSAISEHANYTRHHLLLNNVKFINWDLQWYSHKVHEAIEIQIRLHPKNINSDSRIETPLSVDAYMVRKNTYTVAADWNHNGLLQGNSFVLQ